MPYKKQQVSQWVAEQQRRAGYNPSHPPSSSQHKNNGSIPYDHPPPAPVPVPYEHHKGNWNGNSSNGSYVGNRNSGQFVDSFRRGSFDDPLPPPPPPRPQGHNGHLPPPFSESELPLGYVCVVSVCVIAIIKFVSCEQFLNSQCHSVTWFLSLTEGL